MHLIGWLPHGLDDQVVARGAWRHKVIARPLSEYGLKPVGRGALVLGYTAFNGRKLRTAVHQLKVALAELGLYAAVIVRLIVRSPNTAAITTKSWEI